MISFLIRPDNGEPYKLTAESRDIYVWEKTTKSGKVFNEAVANTSMIDCYEMAHIAARRQGLIPRDVTLQQFVDMHNLEGYNGADDEDSADPTHPAP